MALLLLIATVRNWTLYYLMFRVANGLIEIEPRGLNCKANSGLKLAAFISTFVMLDLKYDLLLSICIQP